MPSIAKMFLIATLEKSCVRSLFMFLCIVVEKKIRYVPLNWETKNFHLSLSCIDYVIYCCRTCGYCLGLIPHAMTTSPWISGVTTDQLDCTSKHTEGVTSWPFIWVRKANTVHDLQRSPLVWRKVKATQPAGFSLVKCSPIPQKNWWGLKSFR